MTIHFCFCTFAKRRDQNYQNSNQDSLPLSVWSFSYCNGFHSSLMPSLAWERESLCDNSVPACLQFHYLELFNSCSHRKSEWNIQSILRSEHCSGLAAEQGTALNSWGIRESTDRSCTDGWCGIRCQLGPSDVQNQELMNLGPSSRAQSSSWHTVKSALNESVHSEHYNKCFTVS